MKKFPDLFYTLNEKRLLKWIDNPMETEGWDFDFKEALPHKNDKNNKNHLIATFCAFANTEGGFLLFGIGNDKTIKGLSPDGEFRKKINDLVGKYIKPPLQNKWDLINQFELYSKVPGKYIFVVHVPESLSHHKPHVCTYEDDKHIYVRQNSSNIALDDGRDIRTYFFKSRFSPYAFKTIDYAFDNLKKIGYRQDYIDELFFLSFREYLESAKKEEPSFSTLLDGFNQITNNTKNIKNLLNSNSATNPGDTNTLSTKIEELKQKQEKLITVFIDDYKKLHGLKI